MAKVQFFFIGEPKHVDIPPGEYEGPLVIRQSCTVDGHGATLWTKKGAALIVDAPNVMIKNFRVELLAKTNEFVAIEILRPNVRLENVEVYGNIRGSDSASENWDLPRTIDFGSFASGSQNEFSARFNISEPCRVVNSVYGLNIEPKTFSPGKFDLRFTVSPMKDDMILYGSFCLETANKILRRIYVSGRAQSGASVKTLPKIQPPHQSKPSQPKKVNRPDAPTPISQQAQTNTEKKFFPVSNFPQSKASTRLNDSNRASQQTNIGTKKNSAPSSTKVNKGQKVLAPNSENIRVALRAADFPDKMTIDACAFCLGKNKKVQREADFIFFNNPRHESLGVSLVSKENAPGISLNLKILPDAIKSVVVCFSIYDEGNRFENNFSKLSSPEVAVFANENVIYEFPVQLEQEKIFTALEIYRDKADWKIHFIGLSPKNDFAKLCESYGLEVL